jgi:hypothetical protein
MEVLDWVPKVCNKPRILNCVAELRGETTFAVHNNSLANLGRALHERVFTVVGENGELVAPPRPVPGLFEERMRWYREEFRRHPHDLPLASHREVVESYTGRKRVMYEDAALSLTYSPLTVADARVRAFVKAEKINISKKPDPAPRLIQPRSLRYNVELGVYLKQNEKRILQLVDAVAGEPTVMSGYNVREVGSHLAGKWFSFGDPVAVGLDASRWDQHCSVDALKFEHTIYAQLFDNDPMLLELLSWQLDNSGIGMAKDGAIRYRVAGGRMSGDLNTGLGNKVLMVGLCLSWARHRQVNVKYGNNGDDVVAFMERRDLETFMEGLEQWFLEMGFTMAVEVPVDILEQVDFCQSSPVCVNGHWTMVRNPLTCISKDSYSLVSMQNTRDAEAWCTAVGQCGLTLTQGVPVLQNIYRTYLRSGRGRTPSWTYMMSVIEYGNVERLKRLKVRHNTQPVAESTRESYYRAFGLSPQAQVEVEQEVDSIGLIDLRSSPGETRFHPFRFYKESIMPSETCLPRNLLLRGQ